MCNPRIKIPTDVRRLDLAGGVAQTVKFSLNPGECLVVTMIYPVLVTLTSGANAVTKTFPVGPPIMEIELDVLADAVTAISFTSLQDNSISFWLKG